MTQWREHSPSTNVVRVRFPGASKMCQKAPETRLKPVKNASRLSCLFSSFLQEFFVAYSGFPLPQKPPFSNFQIHPESEGHRFVSCNRLLGITLVYFFFMEVRQNYDWNIKKWISREFLKEEKPLFVRDFYDTTVVVSVQI